MGDCPRCKESPEWCVCDCEPTKGLIKRVAELEVHILDLRQMIYRLTNASADFLFRGPELQKEALKLVSSIEVNDG